MRVSLIHPSRSRPYMAFATMQNWLNKADKPFNIEYLLMLDTDDDMLLGYEAIANALIDVNYFNGIGCTPTINLSDNKSAIEAINVGAAMCKGDLLIVVSDDFDAPQSWDTSLLNSLEGKSDFIVKTQDGIQKTLITLPILHRAYYERFGYVYHPDYKHMFSDQEMTSVGMMMDKVIDLPLHFEHMHYTVGGMEKDQTNMRNDSSWHQGEALFNERLKLNFGLSPEQIVKPYSEIVWR